MFRSYRCDHSVIPSAARIRAIVRRSRPEAFKKAPSRIRLACSWRPASRGSIDVFLNRNDDVADLTSKPSMVDRS